MRSAGIGNFSYNIIPIIKMTPPSLFYANTHLGSVVAGVVGLAMPRIKFNLIMFQSYYNLSV